MILNDILEKEYHISDLIAHLEKIKEAHGDLPLAHEYMFKSFINLN